MLNVFLKLLNMSITASWLVLAVVVLRMIFKKAPKYISCIMWALVGIRLVFPISFESILSLVPSSETLPQEVISGPNFAVDTGIGFVDNAVNEYLGDRYFEGVTVPHDNGYNVMSVFAIVWIVGIMAMLVYTIVSYLSIHKKVREAAAIGDNIWVCDRIDTPFILGVLRPRIYLPSSMNRADMQYVIAHEKAHLKRRDHLWKPIGFLLLSVYWFNPMMWIAYILLCRDIELACDEKVIKYMGIEIKKPYSDALINCSVPRKALAACPLAFGEVGVKNRIKSVLSYKKPAFWLIIASAVVCAVVAVCFLTNPSRLRIEKHDWQFSHIQKNDSAGEIVFCAENKIGIYPSAEIADLSVRIKEDRNSILLDKTTAEEGESWALGYKLKSRKASGAIYDVSYAENIKGNAVISKTKHSNGSQEYTLAITIGGYTLYFTDNETDKVYTSGTAFFYKEPTDEAVEPTLSSYAVFSEDEMKTLLEMLQKQKWSDDSFTDRIRFNFDGKVYHQGWIFFGYEQKVIYYDHYSCIASDDVFEFIKAKQSKSSHYKYPLLTSSSQTPQTQKIPTGFYQNELADEFGEYRTIGVTLGQDNACEISFSMTGDFFYGEYSVQSDTLVCKLTKLTGEYIKSAEIDIEYHFEILENRKLKFKKVVGEPFKYYSTIDSAEYEFDKEKHFSKGDIFILQDENTNSYFDATVLEVHEYYLLVEPFEDEEERKSSDKISVDINTLSLNPVSEIKVGSKIRVVYDGEILESYPAQLGNVFAIRLLNDEQALKNYSYEVSWVNYSEYSGIYISALNSDKLSINHTQHLPIYKFENTNELSNFKKDFKDYFYMDGELDEIPSFNSVTEKYDENYFEDNALFLVYVPAGSTTSRFGVQSVYNDGETFKIEIARIDKSEVGDCAMAGWFVTVEAEKSAVASCTKFDSYMV